MPLTLKPIPVTLAGLMFSLLPLSASALTIGFEGLNDLESVTTQYAATAPSLGVVFSNAQALLSGTYAGGSLNDFNFPPNPDPNSTTDITVIGNNPQGGSFMTLVFSVPVASVSGEFVYIGPSVLTIQAFGSIDPLAATIIDQVAVETVNSQTGVASNVTIAGSSAIRSLLIQGGNLGEFTLDDLIITAAATPPPSIPEPATVALLTAGVGAAFATRRKRRILR